MNKQFLQEICTTVITELESIVDHPPFGTCYLLGYCIAEGLSRSGYVSREVTGHLLLKDKNEKNIVYGGYQYPGTNVGDYHTWSEVEIENVVFIVDASIKYNKLCLKQYGLKVNSKVPDILVTEKSTTWFYTYVEDIKLVEKSKYFLNLAPETIKNKLILKVMELCASMMETV